MSEAPQGYIMNALTICLKLFKHWLSECMRMVVSRKTILATDRDGVVAELHPPAVAHPLLADALLADMVRRGELTLPAVIGGGPPPRFPVASLNEILAELDESRADR